VRRRLVLSTLTAVLLAVFLLGVPLAIAGDLLLVDQSKHDVQQRARALALAVDHRLDEHETVDSPALQQTLGGTLRGHQVGATVTTPQGTVIVGRIPSGPAYVGEYATSSGVIARVSVAQGDVRLDMVRAGGLVLAISIVAVGAAVALGVFQARRLARPLVQLAFNAERLGAGESRLAPVDSGVAEVDQVAEVLERSAQRMAVTLAAERDFTSDASHQLRTPLTALSMRLEEISAAETVQAAQEEARIALVQVERLTQVVQDLLARSRRAHHDSTQAIALDEVVNQQQQEWTRRAGPGPGDPAGQQPRSRCGDRAADHSLRRRFGRGGGQRRGRGRAAGAGSADLRAQREQCRQHRTGLAAGARPGDRRRRPAGAAARHPADLRRVPHRGAAGPGSGTGATPAVSSRPDWKPPLKTYLR
jgi:signal transduction histidine kinase